MRIVLSVMQVGVVLMAVHHRLMAMHMAVGLARLIRRIMGMLVMLVMAVAVFVIHRAVAMFVIVPFGQMQV
jgi:hypothetical protein